MKAKIFKNRKGTALIVALLVMGVLMAISLALSTLVLRESIVTREFLDAGQSFYAAESASEIGLYGVKNNLPGWEPLHGVIPISVDDKTVAELKVSNKCKAYPCFDNSYEKTKAAPEAFYATLGLNESATIPLFVMGEDGKPTAITDFAVEFYTNFTKDDLAIHGGKFDVNDWDVLRWKIVGLNESGGQPITESISDFTAVSFLNDGGKSTAAKPSWFGTMKCDEGKDRYTNNITCLGYTPPPNSNSCDVTEAREFYLYRGIGAERKVDASNHCYPLKRFVTDPEKDPSIGHKLNYLTLTNLINPSVFKNSKDDAKTRVYYRVELFTDGKATDTVRDYADITADGYSGNSKQSVNVKIKRDSFMPVFNFSLYSTYMDKAAGHDDKYWYGEKKTEDQNLPKN